MMTDERMQVAILTNFGALKWPKMSSPKYQLARNGCYLHCNQLRRSQRKKPRVDSTNESEASSQNEAFGDSTSEPYIDLSIVA